MSRVSVELKAVSKISSVFVVGVNVNDYMSLMFYQYLYISDMWSFTTSTLMMETEEMCGTLVLVQH
jgi:hypothetical protein